MGADINKLMYELGNTEKGDGENVENHYDMEVSKVDEDTLRLHNVGEEANINDVAKFASVRGFNVVPVTEDEETDIVEKPCDFKVERV